MERRRGARGAYIEDIIVVRLIPPRVHPSNPRRQIRPVAVPRRSSLRVILTDPVINRINPLDEFLVKLDPKGMRRLFRLAQPRLVRDDVSAKVLVDETGGGKLRFEPGF
jgi:hypothetical protein